MKPNPVPKVIALVLVTLCIAWWMLGVDTRGLAKIDSMSAADYIQFQRGVHQHSFIFHFTILLIVGGFFVGTIDFLAYLIGLLIPRKSAP